MSKRLSGPLSPKEIEDRFEGTFRVRTLAPLPDDKRAKATSTSGLPLCERRGRSWPWSASP